MDLSIDEAAARMGKTARQVRYLIAQGKLSAVKNGKSWRVRAEDLPVPPGAAKARDRTDARVRAAVEELTAAPRQGASLADLKAFQAGRPLLDRVAGLAGTDHPAAVSLRDCLHDVGLGYHRFHAADKVACYARARDHASAAAVALLLDGRPEAAALATSLENELMPALAGLLRRMDRQGRKRDWPP